MDGHRRLAHRPRGERLNEGFKIRRACGHKFFLPCYDHIFACPQKLTVAQGEGEAINTVYGAIHEGNPTNDLIAIKYLETLGKMADGKATKIFLPYEASGMLGSVAGIAELLKSGDSASHRKREEPEKRSQS